jgi:hypothetical protein
VLLVPFAEAEKLKGGLLLDTREGIRRRGDTGPAVVRGDEKESLLLAAIRSEDRDFEMPPKERLPASGFEDFAQWIKMGAPDPRDGKLASRAASTSTICTRRSCTSSVSITKSPPTATAATTSASRIGKGTW